MVLEQRFSIVDCLLGLNANGSARIRVLIVFLPRMIRFSSICKERQGTDYRGYCEWRAHRNGRSCWPVMPMESDRDQLSELFINSLRVKIHRMGLLVLSFLSGFKVFQARFSQPKPNAEDRANDHQGSGGTDPFHPNRLVSCRF